MSSGPRLRCIRQLSPAVARVDLHGNLTGKNRIVATRFRPPTAASVIRIPLGRNERAANRFCDNSEVRKNMISNTRTPDRSKIIIEDEDHVKYWTRHFGVTEDELARAIERVGNSAAAVRKQLGVPNPPAA